MDFIKRLKELSNNKCRNMYDLCIKLGITSVGGATYREVYNIAKENDIKLKFTYKGVKITRPNKYELSEILTKDSKYKGNNLKIKLINSGLKERKCECCGNTEWMGKPIPLELHHINGDHCDNRLENLMVLCPNCHEMTDNYSGKNTSGKRNYKRNYGICEFCGKKFIKRNSDQKFCCKDCVDKHHRKVNITKEELFNAMIEIRTFVGVGHIFNISDKTVVKWCKKYNLPTKKSEWNNIINNGGLV